MGGLHSRRLQLGRSPGWHRRRRLAGVLSAVACAALAVAGCGSSSPAKASASSGSGSGKKILLGITAPRTGVAGPVCSPQDNATLAWFKHVNAEGGVDGAHLAIDLRDDAYEAAKAVANAHAFISEHVAAVVGGCGSIQQPAIYPLLAKAKIPLLFPWASIQTMVKPVLPYYFTVMPLYNDQLAEAIKWAFGKYGPGSAAFVSTTIPGVQETEAQVKETVASGGGKFVAGLDAPATTADWTPLALRLKAADPEYVVLNMTSPQAASLIKAAHANGFAPKRYYIGTTVETESIFFQPIEKLLDNKLLGVTPLAAPGSSGAEECTQVLTAAKLPINAVTLWGCGTAQVVVAALKAAGSEPTGPKIVSALDAWTNEQASPMFPPLTFSESNHQGNAKVNLVGLRNGKLFEMGQLETKA